MLVPPKLPIREIAKFRLARHHLLDEAGSDAVTICRDICGAQAQLTSAAFLQLWARNHSLTRAVIEDALWKNRKLVRTHLMRQTLHLVPASEYPLYISALRSSRVADALRVMARFRIPREEAEDLTGLIIDALAAGPMARSDITAAVRPKVSRRVREWMGKVWSIVRVPMAEGLVCYGPGEDNDVKLVRVDQWFKKYKPIDEQAAQIALLRKYLSAYGPATSQDFSKWAGIGMVQVKPLYERPGDEFAEVEVEDSKCLLLKKDRMALKNSVEKSCVRLLPLFDPFLLAHTQKDHLIARAYYKRVYRNQGWISAVVLVDGRIAGTWSHVLRANQVVVGIQAFEKLPSRVSEGIQREAEGLAKFLGKNGSRVDLVIG